jgi:hypothetical protein
LDSASEDLTLFRLTPCFEDARDELITICEAEPTVATESTCFDHSVEIARGRKFDSNCGHSIITKITPIVSENEFKKSNNKNSEDTYGVHFGPLQIKE